MSSKKEFSGGKKCPICSMVLHRLYCCCAIKTGGGGGGKPYYPPPSGLFSVALKRFELLTYKFVTFPKYYISKERTEFISTIEGESGLYNRIETTWYRWINSILLIFVNPGLE